MYIYPVKSKILNEYLIFHNKIINKTASIFSWNKGYLGFFSTFSRSIFLMVFYLFIRVLLNSTRPVCACEEFPIFNSYRYLCLIMLSILKIYYLIFLWTSGNEVWNVSSPFLILRVTVSAWRFIKKRWCIPYNIPMNYFYSQKWDKQKSRGRNCLTE